MTQSLAELEQLCNVLYNSHDPNERAHAENVLTPFSTNVDYIPQCKVRRSRRRLARDRSFARTRSARDAIQQQSGGPLSLSRARPSRPHRSRARRRISLPPITLPLFPHSRIH